MKTLRKQLLSVCAILFSLSLFTTACDEEQTASKPVFYKGPLREVDGMEMILTDSARLNIRLTAPRLLEFQNGDQHFTKGVFIEFYNKQGVKTTTLRANRGVRYRASNVHMALGDVVVTNLEKQQTLRTEKLNWNPDTKKLYTDQFVTITTPDELIKGTGLEAAQDMSSYNIRKISGIVALPK
ncbi:MAG: LPS export ABC transporter periplasmic protein LptC [Cytophagales bacterium]|jgi:LPS export ABC transporter protein LptC|nr:LPS export ABC transporter periplasmic protein LptC [Cytophagales bacterium]